MLATVVDIAAILKILLAALVVGVGVTAVYGQAAQAAGRLARARRDGDTAEVVGSALIIGVAAVLCLAALALGFVAMTHKS
jgi:hypothetical protein